MPEKRDGREAATDEAFETLAEDTNGESYKILKRKTFVISHSATEGTTKTEELLDYVTDKGNSVSRKEDGTFELVVTGTMLYPVND